MKHDHKPFLIEWHEQGCDCPACEPYVPSVDRPLSANAIAGFMLAGAAFGNLIAFAIDPAGSAAALADAVGQLLGIR